MPATYTEGGVDAISRLRAEIPDTDITSPVFSDAELQGWLDDTLSDERLLLYLPARIDHATGATAEVTLTDEGALTLTLQRTITGEAADTITLAPGRTARRVEDVLIWVGQLNKRWQVGFAAGPDEEYCYPTPYGTGIEGLKKTGRIARHGKPVYLAPTDGPVTAYQYYNPAILRFYQIGAAMVRALRSLERGGGMVSSKSESDMHIAFDVATRMERAEYLAAQGIYA